MLGTGFSVVDLTKIEGNGEFNCPKCGEHFSPDDLTEEKYTILDTVTKGDWLNKIIVRCNKCRSQIHIIGFDVLNQEQQSLQK